ncbi:Suppressor of fri, partial [Thalictrum thalictroides]
APVGLAQQPLFPIQNVRPPLPSATSLALAPSYLITPPGLPLSTLAISVSQPLFPVSGNHAIPSQSSAFPASVISAAISSSFPSEPKNPGDMYSNFNNSATNIYTPNIPGGSFLGSHSYASVLNTGGPSIGPPPVISNKVPATQPATNEEERRMSLPKYQVHEETSQ